MLLTLDIGNTNVTVGPARGRSIAWAGRARTHSAGPPDELELLLDGLLRLHGMALTDVSAISCASVVPPLTEALRQVAARRDIPLLVAAADTVPIEVRTERPAEVGADRLVNALAAHELYGSPAIVVDLGTATKVDAVGAGGAFLGGAIAPGLALGLEALATRTAKLPHAPLEDPGKVIGRGTIAAIQAGAVLGHSAMVAGLVERLRFELSVDQGVDPATIRVVATGGLASLAWARGIAGVDVIDPVLTLRGLAILAERRSPGPERAGDDRGNGAGAAAPALPTEAAGRRR